MTSLVDLADSDLQRDGYVVLPQQADRHAVLIARRALWLELRKRGATADQIAAYSVTTWFPWLRNEPWIWNLLPEGTPPLTARQRWAEPQLIIRLPDPEDTTPGRGHLDELPPWAEPEERYMYILFVELTGSTPQGGCLRVWPGSHKGEKHRPRYVDTEAGDVVVMHPRTLHAGSPNYNGDPRMAVTFRLLGSSA